MLLLERKKVIILIIKIIIDQPLVMNKLALMHLLPVFDSTCLLNIVLYKGVKIVLNLSFFLLSLLFGKSYHFTLRPLRIGLKGLLLSDYQVICLL